MEDNTDAGQVQDSATGQETDVKDTPDESGVSDGLDDVILDLGDGDIDPTEIPEKTAKTEPEPKDKGPTVEDLQTQITKLTEHTRNLNKALHEERQGKKKQPDGDKGDKPLTRSQLVALMAEHRDDPETMYQIMEYVADQKAQSVTGRRSEEDRVRSLKQSSESFLYTSFPDLTEEGSAFRGQINKVKDSYGLKDHPLGDLFAVGIDAVNNLPQIIANAKELGRKEVLGETAEGVRKTTITNNKLIPRGSNSRAGDAAPDASVLQVARQLGMNKRQMRIYQGLRSGNKKTMTVEA